MAKSVCLALPLKMTMVLSRLVLKFGVSENGWRPIIDNLLYIESFIKSLEAIYLNFMMEKIVSVFSY